MMVRSVRGIGRIALLAVLVWLVGVLPAAHSAGRPPAGTLTELSLIPHQKLTAKTSRATHSQLHIMSAPSGQTTRMVWDFNDVNLGPMVSISKLNQQLQHMGIDTPARITRYPASNTTGPVVRLVVEIPTPLGNTIRTNNAPETSQRNHVLLLKARPTSTAATVPSTAALQHHVAQRSINATTTRNTNNTITFSSASAATPPPPERQQTVLPTRTPTQPAPPRLSTSKHTAHTAHLQKQVSNLTQQLATAEQRLAHTQQQNSTLAQTVSHLKTEITRAKQAQMDAPTTPTETPASAVSQQHLQALRAALEKSKAALSTSVATINQQNQAIQTLKQHVAEMKQGVNISSLDQQTYLDAELSKAQQHIATLKQRIAQLEGSHPSDTTIEDDTTVVAAPAVENNDTTTPSTANPEGGWVSLEIPKYTPFNHKAP